MESKTLKSIVADRGIKQSFIATKLGVSPALVHQWIKGVRPISKKYQIELKALFN